MNQLVRTSLNLEQCRRCGGLFYINEMDRSSWDLDFGCPYGCDDNGKRQFENQNNLSLQVHFLKPALKPFTFFPIFVTP